MSTFIRSWEQYKKFAELQGLTPTYEQFEEVLNLVNNLLKTPEEDRFLQEDLNLDWKEYHKKYPQKTLDEFIHHVSKPF